MEDYIGMACSPSLINVESQTYVLGLGWSPDQFWKSTLYELMSAYAALLPAGEINMFSDDDLETFEEIKKRIEQENKAALKKAADEETARKLNGE